MFLFDIGFDSGEIACLTVASCFSVSVMCLPLQLTGVCEYHKKKKHSTQRKYLTAGNSVLTQSV